MEAAGRGRVHSSVRGAARTRIVRLFVAWAAIALAGSGAGVSAIPPTRDVPQRGVEYLAIIYPAPGQCFPSSEGVALTMGLAPHVYSRWPGDKDAGELCLAAAGQTVCTLRRCCAHRVFRNTERLSLFLRVQCSASTERRQHGHSFCRLTPYVAWCP